jgi:septation ring formation regulator EzrA
VERVGDEWSETMVKLIQNRNQESRTEIKSLRDKLSLVKRDASEAAKEHEESVTATAASFKSIGERTGAYAVERDDGNSRVMGDMSDRAKEQIDSANSVVKNVESISGEEKSFVSAGQDEEKAKYSEMEKEFRMRSDKAPEQMRQIQESTRVSCSL